MKRRTEIEKATGEFEPRPPLSVNHPIRNDSMTMTEYSITDPKLPAPVVFEKDGRVLASSRDVAEFFGKEHKVVLRAVRNLHCSKDFHQRNFVPFKVKDLTGESTSYVEMTKDGFTFLVMGFTGADAAKFKEAYIARFNAMEASLNARDPMVALNDPATMRGLLLTYSEKMIALEGQVSELAPKAEALDKIATADGSFCATDAAKNLQVRPKDLFAYLRSHGWTYRRPGTDHDLAYQSKLTQGLMEHKVTTVYRSDGTEKITTQARVTSKGMTVLAKVFPLISEGEARI